MTLNDIGDRVKELRSKQNLSQKDLALICGFDRTYLSRVESGKQNITIEKLLVLCAKLNVSLKEFFDF
ncbi:MAG TPA: transcriptional regulator [Firmicutes bacterium]|nr:transcriptional regulator [Bacillota bacterium]